MSSSFDSPVPRRAAQGSQRSWTTGKGTRRFLSERQIEAYLLARDSVRRIRRTSSYFPGRLH